MSFFNSLQQYVTSGVAGLGLSPRRFSLSRQESAEQQQQAPPPTVQTERRESNNSQHHGEFPQLNTHLFILYIYYICMSSPLASGFIVNIKETKRHFSQ